jgi:hypothetical protein
MIGLCARDGDEDADTGGLAVRTSRSPSSTVGAIGFSGIDGSRA